MKKFKYKNFEKKFEIFLKKRCVELLRKFIEIPSVNPVKPKVLIFNASIIKQKNDLLFNENKYEYNLIKNNFINTNRKIVHMLLRFIAYCYQDDVIETKINIEHILPKKFKNTYFANYKDEEIEKSIECIGNKILFEKKINIIAGNGYFGKKKEYYKQSEIKQVVNLSKVGIEDFKLEDINKRNNELFNIFVNRCEEWIK